MTEKTILIFKIFFAKWRKNKIMGFTYTFGAFACVFLVLLDWNYLLVFVVCCCCCCESLQSSRLPLCFLVALVFFFFCVDSLQEEGDRPSTRYPVVFFPNSTLHSFSLIVVWLACLTPLSCASLHLNRFYAISESLSFFRRPYIGVIDRKCRGFDRSEM